MSVGPSSHGWPYQDEYHDGGDRHPIPIPTPREPSPPSCVPAHRSLPEGRWQCIAQYREVHPSYAQQWIMLTWRLLRELGIMQRMALLLALILTFLAVMSAYRGVTATSVVAGIGVIGNLLAVRPLRSDR